MRRAGRLLDDPYVVLLPEFASRNIQCSECLECIDLVVLEKLEGAIGVVLIERLSEFLGCCDDSIFGSGDGGFDM